MPATKIGPLWFFGLLSWSFHDAVRRACQSYSGCRLMLWEEEALRARAELNVNPSSNLLKLSVPSFIK